MTNEILIKISASIKLRWGLKILKNPEFLNFLYKFVYICYVESFTKVGE